MEVECCEILVVDDHPIVLEGIKKIASALEGVKCDGIIFLCVLLIICIY